jgi:hypothetical protein
MSIHDNFFEPPESTSSVIALDADHTEMGTVNGLSTVEFLLQIRSLNVALHE